MHLLILSSVIIRKKPLSKMVQSMDLNSSDNISMPKSSSSSTLFTPHSVYSHTTMPTVNTDSKNLESASRKSRSPLSPPPVGKGNILNYFIPASSRDASVQVGEPPVQSEQSKRQIAKVTPFPVSPPTTKPVARVSPQPQSISPPVQQTPVMSVVEEKAKNKDKIEAKSPEAERWTPLKSPPPISSVNTPTVATTTVTSASNTVTNVTPTKASVTTTSTLKSSPTTKTFSSASCPAQIPLASNTPLATEHLVTSSAISTSDTTVGTDGEGVTAVKKKKKKKHHSTTEYSGQEDGVGVEHKKKKKKKKEHREHEPNEEPKKKKKKVKHSSKERVWKEKEGMPATTAIKSPLKSPPPLVSPTVPTSLSHGLKDNKVDEKLPEVTVKQEPTPLPSKREPSLPREKPTVSQKKEKAEVKIENKLRPFLLSYFSSSGSECSSPTMEEDRELDDLQTPTPTPTAAATTADDVFTKEQAIKGNQMLFAYAKCSQSVI